jgi:hypothetical protein
MWASGSGSTPLSTDLNITGKLDLEYLNNVKDVLEITQVKALPVRKGLIAKESLLYSVKGNIENDGIFYLNIDTKSDWLFILIHTDSNGNEYFVSQISMPVENSKETLLLFPATCTKAETFDFGKVKYSGNFSFSEKEVAVADFHFNLEQLELIARNDSPFAAVRNFSLKSSDDSETFYTLRTDFKWAGIYPELTGSYSDPRFYGYRGYNFQLDTDSTEVNINQTCEVLGFTKKDIELFPPRGSEVADRYLPTIYNDTEPISNDDTNCTTAFDDAIESRDNDFYATDRFINLSYTLGSMLVADPIPGGLWEFRINGDLEAEFDPSVSIPKTHEEKIDNVVAGIMVNKNDEGRITSIDIKWYEEDPADDDGYREVTDPDVITLLVSFANIYLENESGASRRYESIDLPEVTSSVTPANTWYFGGDGPVEEQAEAVGVSWKTGGIAQFVHFPRYVYPSSDEARCELPIPIHEREEIDKGQQYNHGPTADHLHKGIDFGFYLPDGAGDYVLIDVVAPCDGIVTQITPVTVADFYGIIMVIRHSETRSSLFGFEPQKAGEDDLYNPEGYNNREQKKQIAVYEGQIVRQGDLIGRLVVSLTEADAEPEEPDEDWRIFCSHLHWSVFPTIPGEMEPVVIFLSTLEWICPQIILTDDESGALDAIFGGLPGIEEGSTLLPVCLDEP